MTDVLPPPDAGATPLDAPSPRPTRRSVAVPVAVLASIGAGVVHAGVIGGHADHATLARLFVVSAVFQVGWGVAAMVRPSRGMLALGAAGNLAMVAAWAVSRTTGISFVDGLEVREAPEFADTACAALGLLAVVAAVLWLRRWGRPERAAGAGAGGLASPVPASFALPGLAVAVLAVPALVVGSNHAHAHAAQAVAPKPYTATLPVDLGGVAGVTAKQQKRAEKLVTDTLRDLPHYADVETAKADGYRSIGDGLTGFEHYLKWQLVEDDVILDPKAPESLVYRVTPQGGRTLVSAMYILPTTYTLESSPDIGGALTQWHIHDNLCLTPVSADGSKGGRVAGLTRPDGTCLIGEKFKPAPMIHVWITPHACGPFAALEGVGAGQIRTGDTRLCDTAHGH